MKLIRALPSVEDLNSFAVDMLKQQWGKMIFSGGKDGLFWFMPDGSKNGTISEGIFQAGLAVEDVDGDGIKEVVTARQDSSGNFLIEWYKPGEQPCHRWERLVIDPACAGTPHDIIFADVDGDGENELLAVTVSPKTSGIHLYKCRGSKRERWDRHTVAEGRLTRGLAAADLNGDGKLEIVSGPDWYTMPYDGPYSGSWTRGIYAPGFREKCAMAVVDITGKGKGDIVAVESNYREGLLSWFENRIVEDPDNPWTEHRIADGLFYAHSLQVRKDRSGAISVFLAERARGERVRPFNWDARLMEYCTFDKGKSWSEKILYKGADTDRAILHDADGDGACEIAGKTWTPPVIHIYQKSTAKSGVPLFRHRFIDRDKPYTATDILAVDVNGDGLEDVVCGAWWYKNPGWERFEIPGISQVLCAHDIDGDGRAELICSKGGDSENKNMPPLSNCFYWLKPVDADRGIWEEHYIGTGVGTWAHGSTVGKLLPGGKFAFVAAYHSSKENTQHSPEMFEIPGNPELPWPSSTLYPMQYGEEFRVADINGDGLQEVVTAKGILLNDGSFNYSLQEFPEGFEGARIDIADIDGDGYPDVVAGEEVYLNQDGIMAFSRLVWFKNPGRKGPWEMRVIDTIRCPHSVAAFDIDGCGQPEIICAEHDPFMPYRSRSRLFIYKKADDKGLTWYRYLVDDRFEHHDGTKVIRLAGGKYGIISHGWADSRYVHLWEPEE